MIEQLLDDKEAAFAAEVRGFLAENLSDDLREAGRLATSVYPDHEASMKWQEILHRRGWAAPSWPVEYGGCEWSPVQHFIFARECALADAPALSPMGIRMVAYAIMEFGTPEQKEYFLPRILTGEVFFCQGYSEPESGSDLASLTMAARVEGDDLVLDGRKIWTTHADEANWIFCLVRTSKQERKQQGITFLLVDMRSPGVEVRPLVMASGEEIQCEIVFDQVRAPIANVLGEIDQGWTVAKHLLLYERGGGVASPGLQVRARRLRDAAATMPGPRSGSLADDESFRRRLAELELRISVLEMLEIRMLAAMQDGVPTGAASSMQKVLGTELSQDLTWLTLDTAGPSAAAYQPQAARPGGPIAPSREVADRTVGDPWQAVAPLRYLNERAGSIYAGTNEIQRNIIAKSELGL